MVPAALLGLPCSWPRETGRFSDGFMAPMGGLSIRRLDPRVVWQSPLSPLFCVARGPPVAAGPPGPRRHGPPHRSRGQHRPPGVRRAGPHGNPGFPHHEPAGITNGFISGFPKIHMVRIFFSVCGAQTSSKRNEYSIADSFSRIHRGTKRNTLQSGSMIAVLEMTIEKYELNFGSIYVYQKRWSPMYSTGLQQGVCLTHRIL